MASQGRGSICTVGDGQRSRRKDRGREQQQSLTDRPRPRSPGAVLTLHPGCIGRIRDPAGQGAVLLLLWILT